MSDAANGGGPAPTATLDVVDGVATLTLRRPAQLNALDLATARLLITLVAEVARRDDVRVLLLAGAGRSFCGGGDVGEMFAATDRHTAVRELADTMHEVVLALDTLAKPVVAAVQGAAAGAGLSLVLLADLVVAGQSSRFLTAYLSAGLTPDCGQSALLPRVVGLRRALELTLTPRVLRAAEALDWGVVSHVVPDDRVAGEAAELAGRLAALPAAAAGSARQLLRSAALVPLAEQLEREAASIAAAAATPEADARLRALVEGRR